MLPAEMVRLQEEPEDRIHDCERLLEQETDRIVIALCQPPGQQDYSNYYRADRHALTFEIFLRVPINSGTELRAQHVLTPTRLHEV